MPKIQEMILKLDIFQQETLLYLNMGYYHIGLNKNMGNLCTTIPPLGK